MANASLFYVQSIIPNWLQDMTIHLQIGTLPKVMPKDVQRKLTLKALPYTLHLGRSLPYEVQNHVRPNFAIPILYAKNHSKFHKYFCGAIKPLELYFVNFELFIHQFEILLSYFDMQQVHFQFFTCKKNLIII